MDAGDWDERYSSGLQWSLTPNVFVAGLCSDLPPGRALDLAAGEGRNAVWLATRGWDVTALDFSQVGLARAQDQARTAGVAIETVVADALDWRPERPDFDLVVVCYLQLDRAGRERAMRTAAAALAPGGHVVVVAHDLSNLDRGTGGPPRPDVLYTADETRDVLGSAGLEVRLSEVRERPVDGADRPALDTVAVAVRA